jgi:hypothetical protein
MTIEDRRFIETTLGKDVARVMSKLESMPSRTLWMELLALLSVNNTRT